jgi:hypothetical protein
MSRAVAVAALMVVFKPGDAMAAQTPAGSPDLTADDQVSGAVVDIDVDSEDEELPAPE